MLRPLRPSDAHEVLGRHRLCRNERLAFARLRPRLRGGNGGVTPGAMEPSASGIDVAVLAAGFARRMGREKLLLDLGGAPVVRRVVETSFGIGPREVLVIVNARNASVIREALDGLDARVVENPRAPEGIGASIAFAAGAVRAGVEGLLLLQGDQPLVDTASLEALLAERGGAAYVAAAYGSLVTTPVLFGAELLPELRALGGDQGAKAVLRRHESRGRTVDLPAWRGLDVDDEGAYRRVCELWSRDVPR